MSKITIDKSKVIIDGHASDLDTCNTLTNLCDELNNSDKFKTVKYENGYGEFESVSENEEKKFAPQQWYDIIIYTNDGSTTLETALVGIDAMCSVTESGFSSDGIVKYTYNGSKTFRGFALKANSSVPDYGVGSTFVASGGMRLYIVEADPGYQVNIKSNNGATILAQNAIVDSVVVTSTGVQLKCGDTVNATYTYSGSKLFAGLSTSANAVAAEYKPGDAISITAATDLYIVENIVLPDSYSTLTALFSDIATVIREKTGDTASIIADDFPDVIRESLQKTVTLISFTISGISYQAEEGMTWTEWCSSGYNTAEFCIGITQGVSVVLKAPGSGRYVIPYNKFGKPVGPEDTITGGNVFSIDNSPIGPF